MTREYLRLGGELPGVIFGILPSQETFQTFGRKISGIGAAGFSQKVFCRHHPRGGGGGRGGGGATPPFRGCKLRSYSKEIRAQRPPPLFDPPPIDETSGPPETIYIFEPVTPSCRREADGTSNSICFDPKWSKKSSNHMPLDTMFHKKCICMHIWGVYGHIWDPLYGFPLGRSGPPPPIDDPPHR